ncbi:MAG: hypothetical protein Q9226_006926, partial [Calogaya cf. arnoldii]
FLVKEAAYSCNAALFRYLVTEYPTLLTGSNRNIEGILSGAIAGGVPIWKIILEKEPSWKDYEFSEYHGCVLEKVLWMEQRTEGSAERDLLQFLLEEGADTDREGDPILETFRCMGASKEIMDLVRKYS